MSDLLFKDLCKRLPYGLLIRTEEGVIKKLVLRKTNELEIELLEVINNNCKPILYPINNIFLANNVGICISKDKTVIPIIELAKKLHPEVDTHTLIKNLFVISKNSKNLDNKYPIYQTHLSEFTNTAAGLELCLECHIDYLGLIELGLAEKINKYVESQYKIFYK